MLQIVAALLPCFLHLHAQDSGHQDCRIQNRYKMNGVHCTTERVTNVEAVPILVQDAVAVVRDAASKVVHIEAASRTILIAPKVFMPFEQLPQLHTECLIGSLHCTSILYEGLPKAKQRDHA